MKNKETIIISLGGSLVAPGEIDLGFLKNFKHSLQKYFGNKRFFILVGGGKICRNYQKALAEFGAKNVDKDWLGIRVSRLNAEVVKQVFAEYSYPKIITDPTKKVESRRAKSRTAPPVGGTGAWDVAVAGGWKPGWSTDYCSVMLAKNSGVKTIINLTNIDYVYDKDPKQFPDAKAIKEINWKDFKKIVGDKWTPGLSMPFDPRASKIAESLKIKVAIINGKNLERLEDLLSNKPFIGTIIS